jgi:peptidylprolyl isomerase
MKHTGLILLMAASAAVCAQTPAKPAAPAATAPKPATTSSTSSAAKPAAPAAKAATPTSPTIAAVIKAPASIPQYKGIQKTVFTAALRYQEIKIGTGAVAEPNKLYKVLYTGWRASDGAKFDSSNDHRQPLRDKDGKPVLGDDGKPKLGDPQPLPFMQGAGGAIPGFDQGFVGMKIGGKRRLFIPWQMAYGTKSMPDRGPDHPGIPAKSDLIFDIELVDVTDAPSPSMHPPMGAMPSGRPIPQRPGTPGAPPASGQPGAAAPAAAPPAPGSSPKPVVPATSTTPTTPATPAAPATPAPATTPAQPQSK